MKLVLFLASLVISVAAFVTFDYFYTATILGSAVSGGAHGFCFARDPVRGFAFQPNCSCIRPWLGNSYEFNTNSLGFRDEHVRDVPATSARPRILILGDSAPEGMTAWQDSFIGRVAAKFPQYEFLNGSVEGYSPSNYLNTTRKLINDGIDFDEAVVFIDLSDAQDEAAFFHDVESSGAVATATQKMTKANRYSSLRRSINDHLLLTNDVFEFFERNLVRLGWYHLELGHGGNEFDLERSAWTYRKVSDTEPYETGYAPLGLEGGINREKSKMDVLWQELAERNIPDQRGGLPLAGATGARLGRFAAGAHLARLVRWQVPPLHHAVSGFLRGEGSVPAHPAGLLVSEPLHLWRHPLQLGGRCPGRRRNQQKSERDSRRQAPAAPSAVQFLQRRARSAIR